jgi:hypothetical protein
MLTGYGGSKEVVELVTNGRLLECHEIFSLFDPHHCAQMVTLIEVLYGLTDYDVLQRSCVGARPRQKT